MFLLDVLKTLKRFFLKFIIVGIIAYPMSLIIGLADTIHPIIATFLDLPTIYAFLMYMSYHYRVKDKEGYDNYKDARILPDKFYYFSETVRIFQEEFYTLAKDAVAFYIFFVPFVLIPSFVGDYEWYVWFKYLLIAVTFPLFDMLVMLLVRRKWFKEYDEFRKEKKYQEFQG